MADEKNINLMPEDLRSREEEIRSGKKTGFHIDLVVPEWQKDKHMRYVSRVSFWDKIKNIFKKQPHFGEPLKSEHKPEIHQDRKKEKAFDFKISKPANLKTEIEEIHLPKKEFSTDFNKIEPKKSALDFSLPADKAKAPAPKKPSFWDKIKNIFSRKKSPKIIQPKPIIKTSDSILFKGPNGNGGQPKATPLVSPDKPFVLEKLTASPEPAPIKSTEPVLPALPDFSIPELKVEASPAPRVEPSGEAKPAKEKKEETKFHQPAPTDKSRPSNGGAEVDLIPAAARTRSWRQVLVLLFSSLIGSTVIVGVFYGILFFQEKNIYNQQQQKIQQISDLEVQILTYEDLNKEISDLGQEIRTVNNVLNKHIYWSNFFAMLEKYTPAEVYYQGLNAGNNGALTLNAIGADYQSPARLLKLLEQPEAKEFVSLVSISSANADVNGVTFDLTLVLNENLFYYGNGPKSQ